MSAKYKDFVHF